MAHRPGSISGRLNFFENYINPPSQSDIQPDNDPDDDQNGHEEEEPGYEGNVDWPLLGQPDLPLPQLEIEELIPDIRP